MCPLAHYNRADSSRALQERAALEEAGERKDSVWACVGTKRAGVREEWNKEESGY